MWNGTTELHRPSFVPVVATVAADDEGNFLNAAWQGAGHPDFVGRWEWVPPWVNSGLIVA
jgi:hypothetical protein